MISIPHWSGRLGTQLFQYAFGRTVNTVSKVAVTFPGPLSSELWNVRKLPGAIYGGSATQCHVGENGFDWSLLKSGAPLTILGSLQDFKFYKPFVGEIRTWLRLPPHKSGGHDEILVHMRRKEFRRTYTAGFGVERQRSTQMWTPTELLSYAVESFGAGHRVIVVTDDRNDEEVVRFAKRHNATVESKSEKVDFLRLCFAQKLVMSESAFSWWAAFLGKAVRVVCPIWERSKWYLGAEGHPGFPCPIIRNDPRFEYPLWSNGWMLEGDRGQIN